MTGYGIDDVPTLALNETQRGNLVSEDDTQAILMAEAVIQVSENDQVIGPISKLDSHSGAGEYHRAFSVLLFNSNNELLLQRRSMDKVTFPGVWANSCCSHPLHSEGELDETNAMGVKRAAVRKLEQELGISPDSISIEDFVFMTKMRYSSRMNQDWIEREVDHILVIQADVEVNHNPNEVSEVMWVNQDQLEMMLLEEREAEGAVAPWFRCIAARVMNPNWWNAIGNVSDLEALSDDLIHDMGDVSHMLPNAIGADLITSIKEVKPLVEQRIESSLRASRHPRLANAMMHLIEGGGKRMRATLPWLVAKAVGDTHSGLLDIGAAIETVHNFTLVHDDIMDDDEVRRGRNAVHIEYDMPTAINAGDAMLAIAFERLVQAENLEPGDVAPLVRRIAWMVRRVSEGQQLDIEFEERLNVSEEDYLEMIEGKTAVMFLTCAEIGARVSGADDEVIQLMAQWGLAVGLCFQLMDDLIDVLSDSATLGKPAGSDVAQGKRTLMVIHALQQPDSKAKEVLLNVLGKGEDVAPEDLQAGLDALEELGSIAYAREKAVAYHAEAHECLDRLGDGPAMVALRELTDFQLARIH
ncbi:MAG: isopentenyl-diphosphate delta-isomerase [Candidatus Poseidonia sp.]|uniref:isopentenyl-diphosphate delta-isomerase n=1 Tax=Poseidonia sp. TaxID=2666344 RepID=UPI0030C3F423|nr:isopentenyl-diphosphate delta-isomerase [Poseidonia sp.]